MKRPGIMWKGVALLAGLAEARAQEFSRSVISVLGDPPPGCERWADGCNDCLVKSGVVVGCTTETCDEATTGKASCQLFADDRPCMVGEDCSPPPPPEHGGEGGGDKGPTTGVTTCAEFLSAATPMPGEFLPGCDADGNFLPVQCEATGECFCAYADTGKELPNSRTRGILTPVQCFSFASVGLIQRCVPYGDACPEGLLSEKCPHCNPVYVGYIASQGSHVNEPVECNVNDAQLALPSKGAAGLCQVGSSTSDLPTNHLTQADKDTLDKWNSDYNDGAARLQDDMLRLCSIHSLQLLCNDEIGQKMVDPSVFCISHCYDWVAKTLLYCSTGQLSADIVHQLKVQIDHCSDDASSILY